MRGTEGSQVRPVAAVAAALLSIGVAAVHVGDQGGLTAFAEPDWLGWSYRLLELAAVVVAVAIVVRRSARLVWVGAVLVGVGPLVGYVLTRTTGLPGDHDDIGNWGEPLGVVSLVVEALLIAVALGVLAQTSGRVPDRAHGVSGVRDPVAE